MADRSLFQPSLLVGLLLCLSVMQSHQQASADTQAHSLGASGGWALDGPGEGASHLEAQSSEHLYEAYAEFHTRAIARTRRTGQPLPNVLLCQPMYGLGNRMRAMMTCLLIALASKRVMFMDWNHEYTFWVRTENRDMPGGQPAELVQLLRAPGFDWSLDTFHALRGTTLRQDEIFHISEQVGAAGAGTALRDQVLACNDLQAQWGSPAHRVASFKSYFWWDLVLHNPNYESALARVLGRDDMGVIRFWEKLGPMFFRPVEAVAQMVEALEMVMLPSQSQPPTPAQRPFRVGLHARIGNNWFDQTDADCRQGQVEALRRGDAARACPREDAARSKALPVHLAKCAVGVLPYQHRSQPITWVVVSDNTQAKHIMRYFLAEVESRERSRLQLGPEPVDSVVRDALNLTEAVATRLQHLVVRVFDMHSGSRILMVDRAVNRSSVFDMQVALAEMLVMTRVDLLVRTQGTTFSTPGYALAPKPTWQVLEGGTHMGTCHLQASSEPMPFGNSDGITYNLETATCWVETGGKKRLLTYPWIYTPD